MTYIDYLNAFNQWLESNPLPGNAQLLFFRLLNVFNRAGWPEYVRVDTLRLMLMSDSKSEKTARAARDKLVEAGLIGFQKGRKGAPNAYFLVKQQGNHSPVKNRVKNSPEIDPEFDPENDRHIKTKSKKKTNITTTTNARTRDEGLARVMNVYMDKICPTPSPSSMDLLKAYVETMGAEVCLRAIDNAIDSGAEKSNWRYIRGTLQNWQSMGVRCEADIDRLDRKPEKGKPAGKAAATDYSTPEAQARLRSDMDELEALMRGGKL